MRRQDFYYDLPQELIARVPLKERSSSRLMILDQGQIAHCNFKSLVDYLTPKDLLIFNDTRVLNARMFGRKFSGGKIEVLLERILSPQRGLFHLKASKAPQPGSKLEFSGIEATVIGREGALYILEFAPQSGSLADILAKHGEIPLPPYLQRPATDDDALRYQTIYNRVPGSVAAPTCGLHFDEAIFTQLREKNIPIQFLTLHVGAGTFQPVRADNLRDHQMHSELVDIPEELAEAINHTKQQHGRVIAVGTTVVRALESAASTGSFKPYHGETNIFIYPGYEFKIVDAMLTNFHLPESSLLMLVSAFAGYEVIQKAYQTAIAEKYRFYSYGDAMFISQKQKNLDHA